MLVMDIGNTHTRLAKFQADAIVEKIILRTAILDQQSVLDALAALQQHSVEGKIWIASVAPDQNALVASAAERIALPYYFIASGPCTIMPDRLKTPETTGVDRLLAAMAAGERYFADRRGGYLVMQCGSAVTVDWVDKDGFFRGGYILPGPGFWLASLSKAKQLPDLSTMGVDWHNDAPGASTRVSMLHGMTIGLPAAVFSALERLSRETDLGYDDDTPFPPLIVSGGWARAMQDRFPDTTVYDDDLVLHGIRIHAERL